MRKLFYYLFILFVLFNIKAAAQQKPVHAAKSKLPVKIQQPAKAAALSNTTATAKNSLDSVNTKRKAARPAAGQAIKVETLPYVNPAFHKPLPVAQSGSNAYQPISQRNSNHQTVSSRPDPFTVKNQYNIRVSYSNKNIRSKKTSPLFYYTKPAKAARNAITQQEQSTCDTFNFTRQSQIDSFPIVHPGCTTVKVLTIDGTGVSPVITSLAGISGITQVLGKLEISNTSVTSLSALSGLTAVGDSLYLHDNLLMTSVGLNNLTVLGNFDLRDLPLLTSVSGISNHIDSLGYIHIDSTALSDLSGLSRIKHVEGELAIGHSPVTDLTALNNIQYVRDYFWLESDTLLTHIGMNNLKSVNGYLFNNLPHLTSIAGISNHLNNTQIGTFWFINTGLTDLTGMDSITSSSNFYIWIDDHITSLHGLEKLNNAGSLSLFANGLLTDITALSGLTAVSEGTLEIASCYTLSDLTGVQNITSIEGGLWMTFDYALNSLEKFNRNLVISNNNLDSVRISYNYQLALCSFGPLCNYLSNGGGSDIHDNATGCSSPFEIISFCTTVNACTGISEEKTWNGNNSQDWDDPDNWTPAGVPGVCTTVTIPSTDSVSYNPAAQSNISIGGLIMRNNSYLDLQYYNLAITRTLHVENAYIPSATGTSNITASQVYAPFVSGSTIEGNFSCMDYGGHAEFTFNSFNGNTVLSDSIGRSEISQAYLNNFYGNLLCIQNSDYGNFYLSNASPGNDYILGTLTVTNNSTGSMSVGLGGDRPIKVQGDVTLTSNAGSVDVHTLTMTGSAEAHIIQGGTKSIAIDNFIFEKYGYTYLNQDVYINSLLNFDSYAGELFTAAGKMIIMNDGSFARQSGSTGFVNGPMKKIGNQDFTFPIGKIENNTIWKAPLSITFPVSLTGIAPSATAPPPAEFTAEYFHHNPSTDGYDTSKYTAGFGQIKGKEYWSLVRNSGTANVSVTLAYDSARSGPVSDINNLQIAGWNGTLWRSWGSGGTTGQVYNGTVKSGVPLTSFGPVAFSFKPVRRPVITIGKMDSVICSNRYFSVPFSLDTTTLSGNTFRVEASDSLGNFNTFFNPTIGSKATSVSDTIQAFTSTFLLAGKHYKIRIVGDLLRDTSVNTKPVTPVPVPQGFTIVGPSPICTGVVGKYYPSIHEPGVTYTWSLPYGGTFTTKGDTAFVTWTIPGYQYLQLSSANSCSTGDAPGNYIQVIAADPVATPSITNSGRWLYSSAPPSGLTYQWYKNNLPIAGATASAYYASAAGTFTMRFHGYCGDGPVSNSITFAAPSASQTINFPPVSNKTYGDSSFSIPVSSTSGLPVSLTITGGPGLLLGNTFTITGTGLVTVIATQVGDSTYDTTSAVVRTFTINKAPQTITFPAISNQTFGNPAISLNATASSGLAVSYAVVSGPASLSGNQLTITGVGTVTVSALQAGDTNYLPASAINISFCVRLASLSPITGTPNICPGQTIAYAVNYVPGVTYSWRLTNGTVFASITDTARITWNTPGTYTLLVSATASCGLPSATDTLSINVINPVQPAAVTNMLPANGVINQQLPLLLSWIPGSNTLSYDLYIWDSATAQPAVPFQADIVGLSFNIPQSALTYNKAYKWRVVAKNACLQTPGTIQRFRLIPLPDLAVSNVQIPATAFSGQTISINWRVTNIGPGKTNTNQSWTDAVFLGFDSFPHFNVPPETNPAGFNQLSFPVRDLLVGTRPNVSALDSGQQYSNSINFTLPVNYSQPLYAYVVTNYPAGANAPLQMSVLNDTARAPKPIVVTLSPTPDLRVDTVFTPASTFSGSTINITYKVKNYGVLTPANTGWSDGIYLSQSPFFDVNNSILLKLPKANGSYYANATDAYVYSGTQLLADSFYTKSVQAVVPNYIFGTYFIYVVTNTGKTVYEGALANNNYNKSQLQVYLTPTPDLTVSALTLPLSAASTTQPVGVNWNIFNAGYNDNIERSKGHYFIVYNSCLIYYPPCQAPADQPPCTTPPPRPGQSFTDSFGFGGSYWIDKVYLSADPSGLNTATAKLLVDYTHGIQNSGLNVDDGTTISECKPLGTGVAEINTINVIRPAANYPSAFNFIMPADLAPGNYYVYVVANATKTVYQYPDTLRVRRSDAIAVQRPDVVVSAISAPATATGGKLVTVSYNVLNNGPGAVFNYIRGDRFYVSASPVFDASAQVIGSSVYTEALPVGTPVSHTFTYVFPPSTSGTRYFYVRANFDSAFKETTLINNTSPAAAVTVSTATPVDLIVSGFTVTDTVYTAYSSYYKYSVTNTGDGTTAGGWTDSLFVSCSPTHNPSSSYYIGSRTHAEILSPNASYSDSFYLQLPLSFDINNCFPVANTGTGYFYIKTNADNGTYEGSNTANNLFAAGAKVLLNPLVDHIVTSVTGADTATVARPYRTTWTVKNTGFNPGSNYYGGWYDGVFFSKDSVFNSNTVFASYFGENTTLAKNQTYTDIRNAVTPNMQTGDYYVFVKTNYTNSIYAEKNISNNDNLVRNTAGAAKKIHVIQPLLPDLTDSITAVPDMAAVGQPLKVVYKVSNKGAGATYPDNWSENIWLSTDFIPNNGNDILLAGNNHTGALLPGQSYTDSTVTTLSLNLTPGNYILISQVNANGNVFESNSNNNTSFSYLTVYRPAPSDLIVESIARPDTVFLGYTVDTAKWIIKNNSPNAAKGISSDGIYLSHTTTLDSSAVLLGIKNKDINMGPLTRDTIVMQPMINNITEGSYKLLVKTDVLNNIVESEKNNNVTVAAGNVYVKVKELPLNVLTANTLPAFNRYYKLIIPDSLRGSTILVSLKSKDSLSLTNQMFIGLGYIPSAAHFDYTYNTPNYGNQDIVMTTVIDSVYYITIRCTSPNPPVQSITLKAVKLPFAVLTVNAASGGNTGNVTVKIDGSLYTSNMIATLTRSGVTIPSSAVYFVNSTTVYATFNLLGKPVGIYNVTLIKADSTMASLANAFSIVAANNGGLITGGGINTGKLGSGNDPGCDPGAQSGYNSQLVTQMVVPQKVFGGWVFVIQINYNNPTNVDIPAQTKVLYSEDGLPVALSPQDLGTAGTSLYLQLTEQNGPPGIIRAGGSGTITIYSKAPLTFPAHKLANFNLK